METRDAFGPKVHVFVCVNARDDPTRSCCQRVGGEEVVHALKEWVAKENLRDRIWISKAKCLGFCNDVGASIVVYPQQKWFLQVKQEDLARVQAEIRGLVW